MNQKSVEATRNALTKSRKADLLGTLRVSHVGNMNDAYRNMEFT